MSKGKIAKLPGKVLAELNVRLDQDGEGAPILELVTWDGVTTASVKANTRVLTRATRDVVMIKTAAGAGKKGEL